LTVLVVIDDPAVFNPPEHNVVKGSWSIESCSARPRPSFRVSDSGITSSISQLFNLVNKVPFFSRKEEREL
jgi:hypothetical protein